MRSLLARISAWWRRTAPACLVDAAASLLVIIDSHI